METRTRLGHNRTGVQMSPFDTAEMRQGADEIAGAIEPQNAAQDAAPLTAATRAGLADAQLRQLYAGEAGEGLGSVPLPGTLTGVAQSGLDMLTGKRPQVLMDKLGERLAFERGGTRLYDALLVKCGATAHGLSAEEVALLQRFRDEEARHFSLVADALRQLGGDPTAQTPCADLVGIESMGLVQAMNDPRTSFLQSLHVMLDAELIDNAAWELLIQLAENAGHPSIAERFQAAVREEEVHLRTLTELVGRLTLRDAGVADRLM